jgi:hypothetical protein
MTMPRRSYFSGAMIVALAWAQCAYAGPFLPERGVIFPRDKAIALTRTCSRPRPGPVEGTWTPKPRQIAELESGLPQEFARAAARAQHPDLNAENYYRQYGGLIIGGRKIIYVNASSLPQGNSRRDWHVLPIIACDDGVRGFGVEYDPKTGQFQNFRFDGALPRPHTRP